MTQETGKTFATDHASTETLRGRYKLVDELGQGNQSTLFLAVDTQANSEVAIKELDLKLVDKWKAIELFEREAQVLESLDHPGIPAYVDAFHDVRADGSECFFLVQQYVDGTPLSRKIDDGWLMDEPQARTFLREMISILGYMQSLNPPVVHRNIKPSNIIVRPNGAHVLVDFGAVQAILPETVGGSTAVGTSGFMAPEQLDGRTTPASDIYGLGATVVNAMTGIDPADFQTAGMKLQFHEAIDASEELVGLLDRMLDPTLESRLQDTAAVLAAMQEPVGGDIAGAEKGGTVTSGAAISGASPDAAPSGELVAWEPTEQRIIELKNNPPRVPLSTITARSNRLTVDVGPIDPPARNWSMPFILMALAIIIGAFTGGCLLVITIPAAIFLTFKGMGYLRPVSERLEMTPETLVIEKAEHRRLGQPKVTSQTLAVDSLYLPHVHRVKGDSFKRGGASMEGTAMPKPGKPGLIFTTADGQRVAFGETILTQHRFIKSGLHDDQGELDWLDDIVTEYMEYVRGGAPEASRAEPHVESSEKRGAPAPMTHAPEQGGAEIDGMLGSALEGMAKSARETAQRKLGWAQGFFEGQSFERPPGSFWTDIDRDGARILHREPKGVAGAKGAFFGVFVLYGMVSVFVLLMLFGDDWGFTSSGSPTFGWVMMGIFSVVGLLIIYKAALEAWGIEEFELTPDAIIHRQKVFGREKTKVIAMDDVEEVDISWRTSSSSSSSGHRRTRTYYYFLIDTAFDEHRFGEDMTKDEKLWAASAIRDHIDAHRQAG